MTGTEHRNWIRDPTKDLVTRHRRWSATTFDPSKEFDKVQGLSISADYPWSLNRLPASQWSIMLTGQLDRVHKDPTDCLPCHASESTTCKCCVVRSPTHLAPYQLVESHKPPTLACPSYHSPLSLRSMRARARKWMERNGAVSCVKKEIISPRSLIQSQV